ncbi:Serine/threonine protein kinase [Trema orientale]|uniref:non-specific serine/threonine protein kinase n=1 Tax=Trema orientale TaxID=63057 RepID=A0A2P5B974_TREOI|nr:Serine/threonine protein kinase [Trema orientale]
MSNLGFSLLLTRIFVIALFSIALTKVGCLDFSFPSFVDQEDENSFIFQNSNIIKQAIQVTPDLSKPTLLLNQSGRALYKEQFRLWGKGKGNQKNVMASFNSTFMLNISPFPTGNYPLGEGLSFILTSDPTLPKNSQGKWLGIVNDNTNGSSQAQILAVEFDTRKSYTEDIDDNHVGLDLNSIYSIKQVSLTDYGLNLSSGSNLTIRVQYDGKNISVFVPLVNLTSTNMNGPVLTLPLNLSDYLPEKVYVGFAGSTGENNTELNCVLSWHFHSSDIDENPNLLWVWIAVPLAVVLLLGVALCLYLTRPCCKGDLEEAYPMIEDQIQGSSMVPKKFQLKELRRATSNFNPKNKLGKGGFGTVYKGVIGDKVVAVKRVSKDSRQGQQEFIAEVTTIGSLSHRNLVKLIGWCYESHELLIVYEFMPNGSLDKFIFRDEKLGTEIPELRWERRRSIIFGVAQALDYLHNGCEKRVLHRDIKSSNIMLDSEFNAKLGDFGLARTIQQSEKTHHTTREIAGTPGYMAPESFLTGRATVETDVYAFGVLVLEVISGRKPGNQNEENSFTNGMVLWIWGLHSNGMILDAVDSKLNEEFEDDEVGCILVLGLACCHPNPHERPSMRTILKVLVGEEDPPMVPVEVPAFVWPSMPLSFKEDGETTSHAAQLTPFTESTGR